MSNKEPIFNLSQSQEDYLKIILDLINEKKVARIKDIAQRKNVSMPSVTEAMHKLADDGFITYTAREFIELTETGQAASQQLATRHKFLSNFLKDILNLPAEIADAEACLLEHQLHPTTLERLIVLYQFLTNCPRLNTEIVQQLKHCLSAPPATELPPECQECFLKTSYPHTLAGQNTVHNLLAELAEGQEGVIIMLGPDTDIRRTLIAKGLLPGTSLKLSRKGNRKRPYLVMCAGITYEITQDEANFIEVAIKEMP